MNVPILKEDLPHGAREYQCCKEILGICVKLVFDGIAVRFDCIIRHEDYLAIANPAVLSQTGPLLKGLDRQPYRQKTQQLNNDYVHVYLSFEFVGMSFVLYISTFIETICYVFRYLRVVAYRLI